MSKSRKFNLILLLILFLAFLLRLRGFESHYLLSSDTARDLLVARGALSLGQLPSVGSFSSAGPFVFGPNWYWFLMIPSFLFPNIFFAPWIILLMISLLTVAIMACVGNFVAGKKLGLITGLITAISPIAITYSTYLTQHGLVEVFSALTVLFFIIFLKTKKNLAAFLMAFAIGNALALHYEALNLIIFLPIAIFADFLSFKSIKRFLTLSALLLIAFSLPLLPLMIWDGSRGFKNLLNIVGYFRVGQYQFYVPNRWLTYAGVFWPNFLGKVFGGSDISGAITGGLVILTSLYCFLRRKLPKEIFWLLTIFLIQFIIFRYYRGERYEGYVVYFHGLLFLIISWMAYQLIKISKPATFVLLIVAIYLGLKEIIPIQDQSNDSNKLFTLRDEIISQLPGKKFSIYANTLSTSNCTYTLSFVLDASGVGDDNGVPLGVCHGDQLGCYTPGEKYVSSMNFQKDRCNIIDMENVSKDSLTKKNQWFQFSKEATYKDVQDWWKAK